MLLATGRDPLEYLWAWGGVSISWLPWDQWEFCEFVWELLLLRASLSNRADRIMKDQLYKVKQMQFCDFECGTGPQPENNPCAFLPPKTVTLRKWLNHSKPWLSSSLLPGGWVTNPEHSREQCVKELCNVYHSLGRDTQWVFVTLNNSLFFKRDDWG